MANRDNPRGFEFAGSMYGGSVGAVTLPLLTASSTTITKGDAVILASGYVDIALSNSGSILGVATQSVTTGAGDHEDILVIPALPAYKFRAQCSGTMTQALMLSEVDIEGGTGVMEVNENANTEKVVQIVALDDDGVNVLGANADVIVRFVRSNFADSDVAL